MITRWTCHLIFDVNGVVSMTKGPPNLRSGQRAVKIRLSVPSGMFSRAYPEATVHVPEEAAIKPEVEILPVEAVK